MSKLKIFKFRHFKVYTQLRKTSGIINYLILEEVIIYYYSIFIYSIYNNN